MHAKAGSCRRCCESSFFVLEIPKGIFSRYVYLLSKKERIFLVLIVILRKFYGKFNLAFQLHHSKLFFSFLRNPRIPRIKINEKCQFDYLHCCNCLSSKKLFQSKKSSSMIKVLCNQLKFEIFMIQDVCHCSNFVK